MSATPILHHHDPSPFAEKIRLIFGIKDIAWQSVQIPMMAPKPDLTCLTGGYRGTPVLQIGADIYCDTRLIAEVLEEKFPTPALLNSGPLINFSMQHWSDETVFPPGSALAMFENADQLPPGLLEERAAFFKELDFSTFKENASHYHAQFEAHAAIIDQQLNDDRLYIAGNDPEWIDINAYFSIWMAGGHFPSAERYLNSMEHLCAWRDRMAAFGHGRREEIVAEAAIATAQAATPADIAENATSVDQEAFSIGDAVKIEPMDRGGSETNGRLVSVSNARISIARHDDRVGDVMVHFPRIGYRVSSAQ